MKPKDARPGVLYVSYDGLLEPLGESQVLGYLMHLSEEYRIWLITFEKKSDWTEIAKRKRMASICLQHGIEWLPLRYHKFPSLPATAWDLLQGFLRGVKISRRESIALIHARSYVAATMALLINRVTGIPYLFDTRGLWVDERVDGGLWTVNSAAYRAATRVEKWLYKNASQITCLTALAKSIIVDQFAGVKNDRVSIIPTCVDLEAFSPSVQQGKRPFTLGYVGSVGTWYRFDQVLEVVRVLFQEDGTARFLIINRGQHEEIQRLIANVGIDARRIDLLSLDRKDVPTAIRKMDAGVMFYCRTPSKLATLPTRLAEFLACGKPILCNEGLGDLPTLLNGNAIGVSVDYQPDQLRIGLLRLMQMCREPNIAERCRALAERHFSKISGARTYQAIYQKMLTDAKAV